MQCTEPTVDATPKQRYSSVTCTQWHSLLGVPLLIKRDVLPLGTENYICPSSASVSHFLSIFNSVLCSGLSHFSVRWRPTLHSCLLLVCPVSLISEQIRALSEKR